MVIWQNIWSNRNIMLLQTYNYEKAMTKYMMNTLRSDLLYIQQTMKIN